MKLRGLLQGPVLFTYPAINVSRYEWSRRPLGQRMLTGVLGAAVFFAWMFVSYARGDAPRQPWYAPIVIMLIICAVFAIITTAEKRFGLRAEHPHRFFDQSAYIYTGKGKGGLAYLFPNQIKTITQQEIRSKDVDFYLFTITHKDLIKGWLPNRTVLKFGIPVDADLRQLNQWLERHGLLIDRANISLLVRTN